VPEDEISRDARLDRVATRKGILIPEQRERGEGIVRLGAVAARALLDARRPFERPVRLLEELGKPRFELHDPALPLARE
jgi:hypothetical protein